MRNSRCRRFAATILLGVLATSVAACGDSENNSAGAGAESSLNLVLVPATVSALPLIAEQEGFFEAHHLDVKITQNQNLATFAPALGRQYDVAWGTPADVITAKSRGIDVRVIAGEYRDSSANQQAQIFVGKDSGITTLADLRGKRIATPTLAGTLYLTLVSALAGAGLKPEDVTLVEVPFPNMLDQLNAGRVDAAATIQPFGSAMAAAGQTPLGDPFLSIADPSVAGMWIASSGWVKEHPDQAEAFAGAIADAAAWTQSHKSETRDLLRRALKLPAQVAQNVPLPDWSAEIAAEDLDPWLSTLEKSGQLGSEIPSATDLIPQPIS